MPASALTAQQLKLVFPQADTAYLGRVADELNTDPPAYGLDTPLRRAHFFAQVRQECGPGLEPVEEDLTYSPAALLKFSYYKRHPDEAAVDGYARDPATRKFTRRADQQAIANKAYGGNIGNGDVASGDGWRFRGRGFIQVTGRGNYSDVTRQCRKLYPGIGADFVTSPELLGSSPGAERSAVAFWTMKNLHKLADQGAAGTHVDSITAVINRDTDSYAARRANFSIALNAFR